MLVFIFLSSTSWYSWVCWFWFESFLYSQKAPWRNIRAKSAKGIPTGWSMVTHPTQAARGGHDFHHRPRTSFRRMKKPRFWVKLGYIWLPWSGLLQATLDQCCLFSRICVFASAHFPSWYLDRWEQPWWFGVGQALELTIWQRLLGKYSWGLPLRNSDCDIISIHVHCPNRGIISKHKGYSHINGRDTMAQGILDLRVYILTQENW